MSEPEQLELPGMPSPDIELGVNQLKFLCDLAETGLGLLRMQILANNVPPDQVHTAKQTLAQGENVVKQLRGKLDRNVSN